MNYRKRHARKSTKHQMKRATRGRGVRGKGRAWSKKKKKLGTRLKKMIHKVLLK